MPEITGLKDVRRPVAWVPIRLIRVLAAVEGPLPKVANKKN